MREEQEVMVVPEGVRQVGEEVDSPVMVAMEEHQDKSFLTSNNHTEDRPACRLRILDLDLWEVQVDFISHPVVAMVVIQGLANLEQTATEKIPALSFTLINSCSKKK